MMCNATENAKEKGLMKVSFILWSKKVLKYVLVYQWLQCLKLSFQNVPW